MPIFSMGVTISQMRPRATHTDIKSELFQTKQKHNKHNLDNWKQSSKCHHKHTELKIKHANIECVWLFSVIECSFFCRFCHFLSWFCLRSSGQVRPRQGTEICNFGAPSPLEALHWIFAFSPVFMCNLVRRAPESSEKSSGEYRVK